jgi:NAD(P)-dependent dehydrogenase (short-subunit alcohol dehydrogenase family)
MDEAGGHENEPATDPRHDHELAPLHGQEQEAPGHEHQMAPRPDDGAVTYRGYDRLRGRVALVTGADSGIGRAVAIAFAKEGADVAIAYLDEHEDAEGTRRVIEGEGRRALLLPGDLADPVHCREIVQRTADELGRLDILVNNAAYQGKAVKELDEIDAERLEHTFRTNIIAMFHTVQAALPHLRPGATIINVTSVQAYDPSPEILDYAATKGAIVTFTKGLARKLTPQGIRVNAVAPGAVWTPIIAQSFDEERIKKHGKTNLLGRSGQPVELAPAFVFLASDESSFVTGEVLGVTGGVILP